MTSTKTSDNSSYEEISLRELILTLWNGKAVIAIITAAALLISIIYSYAILENIYEANTIFKVSTIKVSNASQDEDDSIYADIDNKLALSADNYAALLTSNGFLARLIDELDLRDDDGEKASPDLISSKITTKTDEKNPDYVSITVTDTDPNTAFRIADGLHAVLIDTVNDYVKNNINEYKASIEFNLDIASQELTESREALNAFRAENGDTELLVDEIDRLRTRVNSLNASIISLEAEIEADITSLDIIVEQLRNDGITDIDTQKIVAEIKQFVGNSVSEYVGGEIYLQTDLDSSNNQITNSVRMVELNRLQMRLLNSYSSIQSYTEQLNDVNNQYHQKQQDYVELNPRYSAVKNVYDIMSSTYNSYAQKHNAVLSINTLDLANPHISLITRAETPDKPVGPRRTLNVAIAIVLGLMLGVFIVFFREYWKHSSTNDTA